MAEVTAPQAAEVLSVSLNTVHRKVDSGALKAREQGTGERKFVFIDIEDLRNFAEQFGYRFDEAKAKEYAQ